MIGIDSVRGLVEDLRVPDAYRRLEGIAVLRRWRGQAMTDEAAAEILRSVDRRFPRAAALGEDEPAELLVRLLWDRPRSADTSLVDEAYQRADDPTRLALLHLLALRADEAALSLLGRLLSREARVGAPPDPAALNPLSPLVDAPRATRELSEGLVAVMAHPSWSRPATAAFTAIIGADLLPSEVLVHHGRVLADRALRLAEELDRRWDGAPVETQPDAGRSAVVDLADVLGSLRTEAATDALYRLLASADPWLAVCAAAALVAADRPVAPERLRFLAREHATRLHLVERLGACGRADLLPEGLTDQIALAESELVCHLMSTDADARPRELEFLGRRPVDTREGAAEVMVFRFQVMEPHWAARDGWLIAVCGPYLVEEQPTTRSLGEVLSSFRSAEDLSLDEQLTAVEREFEPAWRAAL